MPEEVSYSPQELQALAEQTDRSVAPQVRSAEARVMDAARYQDAGKWGDGDLAVTQGFGKLYEKKLEALERDIRQLLHEISTFSDDVKAAAREAELLDEKVAEDISNAARSLAGSEAEPYVAPRGSAWEG